MEMLLLVLLLLWNDKEGAHATQGKQTYCFDMPSFLIVVVDCDRQRERRSRCMKKLKLNERNVVMDSFEGQVYFGNTVRLFTLESVPLLIVDSRCALVNYHAMEISNS